jgi:ABC-type transport system substrate-binding protein
LRNGKLRRGAAALAVGLTVLAGCSGGGKAKAKGAAGTGKAASSSTAASEVPVKGGRLRIGLTRPATLDPAQARTVEQLLLADQLFDSLTAYDPKTLAPVPAVAAAWQVSTDQRQYDFGLRPDAVFANGRPITADDVKYSIERIARKGSNSPAADELSLVSGFKAFAVDGTAPGLAGITIPQPGIVRISLDAPWAELPVALASPVFGIVPREAVEAAAPAPAFGDQPVGSGPFKVSARAGDHLTLDRSPGSKALVDGIDVSFYDTIGASYQAMLAGSLDWSRVPPEEVEGAASRFGRAGFQPYLAELFFGFNLKSPVFADVRFREAIVRAVDRKAIATTVYQDTVLPLDSVVPAGVPGHLANACGDKCIYDQDKAKALVAAVFPPGTPVPTVNIDFDADPTNQKVAEVIKTDLEDVGIPAALRPKPVAEYADFAAGPDKQLFRLAWIAPYPSPDAFLPQLFASASPFNLEGFSNPTVDATLGAARAEPNEAKRAAYFAGAEKTVMGSLPVLPVAQFLVHSVAGPKVRDLRLTSAGTFDASKVWFSKQ